MTTIYKGDDAVRLNGEGADRSLTGIAASWSRFFGTPSTIQDSINVSSLTDYATGDFFLNLTNAMASTDSMAPTYGGNPKSGSAINYSCGPAFDRDETVSGYSWFMETSQGAAHDNDSYGSNSTLHGDLA